MKRETERKGQSCMQYSQMGKLGFMKEVDLIQILLLGLVLVSEIQFQTVIIGALVFIRKRNYACRAINNYSYSTI